MMIWVDAQLSPRIARWISERCDVDAIAVRDLGLRDAEDDEIFAAAREASVIVLTKDRDFIDLSSRLGPPPSIIWLTCGNTSNRALERILNATLADAMEILSSGEAVVEINSPLHLEP